METSMNVDRRALINGAMFSGLATLAPAQQGRSASQSNADDAAVARAIDELNTTVRYAVQTSPELARIRDQQRVFLRANQKFPDFIEVGVSVWENVVDWHIRHQQSLSVSRSSEGRYIMALGFTTLILRPELSENYVGPRMDAR
jgi:hypothetical protein